MDEAKAMRCERCNVETYIPFRCQYCELNFCVEHRLPENHECSEYWRAKKPKVRLARSLKRAEIKPPYQYSVTIAPPKRRGRIISFSMTETKHLFLGALLTLAIGFSMPLYWEPWLYGQLEVLGSLALVFMLSFIIHELAHKAAAQHYGLWAEFRITLFGALITLFSIVSPFKIISPGAVMVVGAADKETIGKTSIAGPLTNVNIALIFLLLLQTPYFSRFSEIMVFGAMINSFIALFNLIPFGALDGFKVFFWNKIVWTAFFSASLALTFYSYMVF